MKTALYKNREKTGKPGKNRRLSRFESLDRDFYFYLKAHQTIVTRFGILFGTRYEFGYAVRDFHKTRYVGGIQSRYAVWVRGTFKYNNWYVTNKNKLVNQK